MMNDEPGRGEQRDRPPERDWRSLVIWALALLILAAAVYFLIGLFLQSGEREQTPEPEDVSLHHPTLAVSAYGPQWDVRLARQRPPAVLALSSYPNAPVLSASERRATIDRSVGENRLSWHP